MPKSIRYAVYLQKEFVHANGFIRAFIPHFSGGKPFADIIDGIDVSAPGLVQITGLTSSGDRFELWLPAAAIRGIFGRHHSGPGDRPHMIGFNISEPDNT